MKRLSLSVIASCMILLAWCTTSGKAIISFDGLSMSISQDFTALSNAQLDGYQIINKILRIYKNGTTTLIVARSSLEATLTPQTYAEVSKEKVAQTTPGYEHIDDGAISFSCGDEKIQWYTHKFAIADTQQDNTTKVYLMQYYFIAQGIPYIISEADATSSHYSDFTSIINSLHCN